MIEKWISDIKQTVRPQDLGMILVHNGIVRATSKDGRNVQGMKLSYDLAALERVVEACRAKDGIADIRVWINEGMLSIGDDIMKVCVAGRFRTDILPVFQELLTQIKTNIVREEEL